MTAPPKVVAYWAWMAGLLYCAGCWQRHPKQPPGQAQIASDLRPGERCANCKVVLGA